jgi:uncharacterized membrane protein YadS
VKPPKVQIPWFIGLFVLASVVRSLVPGGQQEFAAIVMIAKALLSLTLFLIGAGLSRAALQKVGIRPLAAGILLWIIVGLATVIAIQFFGTGRL